MEDIIWWIGLGIALVLLLGIPKKTIIKFEETIEEIDDAKLLEEYLKNKAKKVLDREEEAKKKIII